MCLAATGPGSQPDERDQAAAIEALAAACAWPEPPSLEPQYLLERSPPPGSLSRIVTVAPSVTELLFAIDAGDRVVGVSRFDDYPPATRSLPKVGGFLDPSVEAVVGLAPSLVIGVPNAGNRVALERMAALGVPVLVVPGNTLADVFHATRTVGALFGAGHARRAAKLCQDIGETLRTLRARAPKSRRPRVAVVYGTGPLVLGGRNSFAGALVEALGGVNVAGSGPPYAQFSIESLLMASPDLIIDVVEAHAESYRGADTGDQATHGSGHSPIFAAWPALRETRVRRMPLGALLRPSPRLVPAIKLLFDALYEDPEPSD